NEDKSNNSFAYQGILGVSYQITPKIKAMIDYRYLATAKKVLKDIYVDRLLSKSLLTTNTTSNKKAYSSSSAMIGLSYSFGELNKKED
ncbi:MAG: P44/Msp2 family outer membrane protein, partial [Rhodospirillaceae bacterium]|nr:P44/Msp2 family outer membrane protein [Rhodospirillaceae bacterium]